MIEGAVARVAHQEKPIRPESEFRRLMLQRLEKLGIVERKEERMIVDIDRLRTRLIKQIRQAGDLGKEDCDIYFQHGQPELLYTIFRDAHVISKQDWEREGIKAKPKKLFYTPETAENAFDPQKIRTQDFYLGLWEVPLINQGQKKREAFYPSRHEHLRMNEVAIAALVYHPRYGDGSRDERGRLFVYNPVTGGREPIQGDSFPQMGFTGGGNEELGGSLQTPREYLKRHAPQIIQRGLLRLEDFRATTVADSQDRPVERFKLNPNGMLMMHGVLHTLGRRFARLPYHIKELSPGVGGMIETMPDGSRAIRYMFKVFHPGDPGLKKVKFGGTAFRDVAGVELTNVQPYHGLEAHRIEHVKIAEAFWKELQVNFAGFSLNEQKRLARSIEGLDQATRDRLKVFAKRFGMEGVRTFLSVEADARRGKQILHMVDQLGDPIARSVFDKYNSILDLNEQTTDEMVKHLFVAGGERDLDRTKLGQEFGQRATRVLLEFISKAQTQGKKKRRAEDLMEDLNRYQDDLVLFAGICKTLKGQWTLEQMRDVGISRRTIESLTDAERADMESILKRNWAAKKTRVYEEMKQELFADRSGQAQFFLFKKGENALGYVKFETVSGQPRPTLHGDFFNMDSVLQDSGIGDAMLKRVLDGLAKEHMIRAEFYPESDVGAMYIERFGFVATHAEDGVGKGKKIGRWIGIVRDDQMNKQLSREAGRRRLLKGETRQEQADTLFEVAKRAHRDGKVISRYMVEGRGEDARRYVVLETPTQR